MEQATDWKSARREARDSLECFSSGVRTSNEYRKEGLHVRREKPSVTGEPKSMFDPYDSEIAGEGNDQMEVDPLTWNSRWRNGGLKLQPLVTRRGLWQEETDLLGKRKESSTPSTFTALAKPRWSSGQTGRQRMLKSCAHEETWTGLWNRQGATHEQNKPTFWLP
jgi:hypothetical protein